MELKEKYPLPIIFCANFEIGADTKTINEEIIAIYNAINRLAEAGDDEERDADEKDD